MIIPGLTDRYNPEDLKAMSLEELLDLQQVAEEKHAEIMMQVESLQQSGGISRAHASGIVELLPPGIVLESYTDYVTQTNYDMTLESLSTAAKVAMAVAVVAGLGAIIFYVKRISDRKVPEANKEAMSEVEKRFKARAEARKILEEEKERIKVKRENFVANQPNNGIMVYLAYANKYSDLKMGLGLSHSLLHFVADLEEDYKKILLPAIDAAERSSKSGDLSELSHLKHSSTEGGEFEKVADWLAKHINETVGLIDRKGLDTGDKNVQRVVKSLVDWAGSPASVEPSLAGKIYDNVVGDDDIDFKAMDTKYLVTMIAWAKKMTMDLPKQEERLEKLKNIPSEIMDILKSYIESTKKKLRLAEAVQELVSFHTNTFNRAVAYLGKDATSDIREQIRELEKIVEDPDRKSAEKAEAYRTLATIKSIIGV